MYKEIINYYKRFHLYYSIFIVLYINNFIYRIMLYTILMLSLTLIDFRVKCKTLDTNSLNVIQFMLYVTIIQSLSVSIIMHIYKNEYSFYLLIELINQLIHLTVDLILLFNDFTGYPCFEQGQLYYYTNFIQFLQV